MSDEKITGLIGRTLSHSMSPFLHSQMGDGEYRIFETEPSELSDFILNREWDFVNVTVPYKKAVIPLCTSLTERARAIGSVNTLVKRNGEIIGDNTDLKGFADTVRDIDFRQRKVAILGTGGVSLTVRKYAEMSGASEILHISRTPESFTDSAVRGFSTTGDCSGDSVVRGFPTAGDCSADSVVRGFPTAGDCSADSVVRGIPYAGDCYADSVVRGITHTGDCYANSARGDCFVGEHSVCEVKCVGYADTEAYSDCDILINATPVGRYPDSDKSPISLDLFTKLSAVVDLIYNPIRTRLVLEAKARGIYAVGGLRMLCSQAHEARCFFGDVPTLSPDELEAKALRSMENIAFIGMPGSGKSTVARIIAKRLRMGLTDTDREIVKKAGMKIPKIFEKYGEATFRELEREQIRLSSSRKGTVIATGGGSILYEVNRLRLMQSSFIIWLDCPKEHLSTRGRPLSSTPEKLDELYKARMPIYEMLADARVEVSDDNSLNITQVINIMKKHYRGEL